MLFHFSPGAILGCIKKRFKTNEKRFGQESVRLKLDANLKATFEKQHGALRQYQLFGKIQEILSSTSFHVNGGRKFRVGKTVEPICGVRFAEFFAKNQTFDLFKVLVIA